MTDRVGRADYELGADTTRLKADLAGAEGAIKQSGQTAESAFGRQATAGMAKAGSQARSLRSTLKGMTGDLRQGLLGGLGLGAGLGAFTLLTAGIGKVVDILGDAVRMAAAEEAAIAQLTRSIKENDAAWDGNVDAVEALISARQKLAFSDGEQRESLRSLVSITKDLTEAEDLLGQAMDLSRLKGISLSSASDLLGKVWAGNLGTLSRYGIVLEKGATATEALAEIQRRARGQAAAYAETNQGKLVRSQIALDDAMEDLGKAITPVVGYLAGLAAETIPDLTARVGDALKPVGDLAGVIGDIADEAARLNSVMGRDFVNDGANALRFLATFGIAPLLDKTNELGFGFDDLTGRTNENARAVTAATTGYWAARRSVQALITAEHELTEEEIAEMLREQAAAAAKLDADLSALADSGFKDVRESAKETQQALRQAFRTPDSMKALLKEERQLIAARQKAIRLKDEDAFAIATVALEENRAQQDHAKGVRAEMRAITARRAERRADRQAEAAASKAARRDFIAEQVELGKTREEARKLWQQTQQDHGIDIPVDDHELDTAKAKADALIAALRSIGPTPSAAGPHGLATRPRRSGIFGDPDRRAHGGPLFAGRAYLYGEDGPEIGVATQPGYMLDSRKTMQLLSGQSGGSPASGGNSAPAGRTAAAPVFQMTFQGTPLRAETPTEIVQQVRRAARMGVLTPRRSTSWRQP